MILLASTHDCARIHMSMEMHMAMVIAMWDEVIIPVFDNGVRAKLSNAIRKICEQGNKNC